ncbi:MAG TPA: indolepyruvate oxidoreductase subunit beta [Candidatus Sulfotelmatobacter sp.]|nr:indolepyruvate oxidoreductase subunit beta [Candidatus Sulfotelmatobacter sp.]
MKLDVVFCGVGGQGVVALSDIFCEAALIDGFDVAKAEVHGMAQRGGSITAHARLGDKVEAPLIERGKADILLGFEMLEAARNLSMLKKEGTIIVNNKYLPPSVSQDSSSKHVTQQQLSEMIHQTACTVYEIDALGIATKLGNLLVVNTILLGALSALPETPIRQESFEKAICGRFKEKYVKINLEAFQLGRETVKIG